MCIHMSDTNFSLVDDGLKLTFGQISPYIDQAQKCLYSKLIQDIERPKHLSLHSPLSSKKQLHFIPAHILTQSTSASRKT